MLEGEDGGGEEVKEWRSLGEVNLMNYKSLFVDKRQGIHAETSACNVISLEQEVLVFAFKVLVDMWYEILKLTSICQKTTGLSVRCSGDTSQQAC